MDNQTEGKNEHAQTWRELAGLVNNLPVEEREQYRAVVGNFMHDMKHTLGLITNANEILRRDVENEPGKSRSLEMLNIIRTGALQMDGYLNTMVEEFANHIKESGK
jgi:hypothetical protein